VSFDLLSVDKLCKSFGGVQAVNDLTFKIGNAEIVGLIGPNGSGKSTTVNALAGVFPVTSGVVSLNGTQIQSMPEHKRVEAGLARTFQTASIFPEFTVREQITLGCDVKLKRNPLITAFSLGQDTEEELLRDKKVEQILDLTGLSEISEQTVGTISAAAQRFTMIATALASSPDLLLLDEPAAGLVSQERDDLANLIRSMRNQGVSVLVIEHHMSLIMDVCDRIVVLNFGSKIAEGTPSEIKNNKAVIDAYLGETA